MIEITTEHVGKIVRIQGVVPVGEGQPILGQGNHVGVITKITSRKFRFKDKDKNYESHLSIGMWRIEEILA